MVRAPVAKQDSFGYRTGIQHFFKGPRIKDRSRELAGWVRTPYGAPVKLVHRHWGNVRSIPPTHIDLVPPDSCRQLSLLLRHSSCKNIGLEPQKLGGLNLARNMTSMAEWWMRQLAGSANLCFFLGGRAR